MEQTVNILIDLTEPSNQELKITLDWKPNVKSFEFSLPIWTPGSYKVRDHVQYLYKLHLSQGEKTIETKRTATNMWNANLTTLERIKLSYTIEARNLTVRTCYLDPDFASLCLSGAILLIEDQRTSRYNISLNLPSNWRVSLPLKKDGSNFIANNYDDLVDAPLTAGDFTEEIFYTLNNLHKILKIGSPPRGWPREFLNDVKLICESACRIWNQEPPSGNEYVFNIQMLDKAYGGLEHDNSSVIQFDWRTLYDSSGYRKLLQLIGHEYFHQWNIRRLRPIEYTSYNYNKIVMSESLWFAEGVTSYYDLAIPMIAGITSENDFLFDLSRELTVVLDTPGRYFQSIADSSRESWVKFYNSSLASKATQINYYRFGTILSLCLDIRLRQHDSSLSQLLRSLWDKFGRSQKGYSREDIKQEISYINKKLSKELDVWLDVPNSLPIISTIDSIGLTLIQSCSDKVTTGLLIHLENKAFCIKRVDSNSPASRSGLVVNDEIIACDDFRLESIEDLNHIAQQKSKLKISFFRRGILKNTILIPESSKENRWELVFNKNQDEKCKELRKNWLKIV